MSKVPKNWRAVEDCGEVIYLVRNCGCYYVMPECGEWHAYHHAGGVALFAGAPIGKGPTRDHALLICREHLHSTEVSSQRFFNNESQGDSAMN